MVGGLELSDTLGVTNKGADSSSLESYNADELGLTVWMEGGGILIKIVITDSMLQQGEKSETQQLCCIPSYVHTLYLSREDLGSTVSKEFTNKNTATCHPALHSNHGEHIIRMD